MPPAGRSAQERQRWLASAGRALLFLLTFRVLQWVLQGALISFAPAGAAMALLLATSSTLAAALLAGTALLRLLDGRGPAALGLAPSPAIPKELGVGLLAGVAPQLMLALVMLVAGTLRFAAERGTASLWLGSVGGALAVLAVAAAAEEAVFRGYGFQALVRGFGSWPTLLFTSGLFALAHARNPGVTPVALLNIFLAGVVLGLAYLRTLSLWLVTALHLGWNWAMASLLDLPVSGLTLFDTPLYEPVVAGPRWFAGGDFGPEGGILGTAGLLVALLIICRWPGLGPSAAQLAARPLPLQQAEGGLDA